MFEQEKVLVLGAGISGFGAVRALVKEKADISLYDENIAKLSEQDKSFLQKNKVDLLSKQPSFQQIADFTYVVLSPGISVNHPLVLAASEQGIKVIGEMELAACLYQGQILAITGTNGKTTTTTLVAEMLKTLPQKSAVGGNIGQALSALATELSADSYLVAEISSFQLESSDTFKPHIAAILNITPDHLDRHGDLAGYIAAKELMYKNQTGEDYLILNYDDQTVRSFAEKTQSKVCFFSVKEQLAEGFFVHNQVLYFKWLGQEASILPVAEMKIFGVHNVENALASCACAFLAGVNIKNMAEVLRNFDGVEHRIEFVRELAGVKYYNDSKATNPESAIKALEAFSGQVILLAGGYDKLTDLTEFMRVVKQKTALLILLGQAKERFAEDAGLAGVENLYLANSFEEAVEHAYKVAKAPQVVLLSPACSSYDMFDNFEQRGCYFKQLVQNFK